METNDEPQKDEVTQRDLEILEIFISNSLEATVRAKKAIIWFLRQSNYLQSNIAMSISSPSRKSDEYKWAQEVGIALHDMRLPIRIDDLFSLMRISKRFVSHCGVAKKISDDLIELETGWDSEHQRHVPVDLLGYTIWLADEFYQKEVYLIEFKPAEVKVVKLRKDHSDVIEYHGKEFYEDCEIPKNLRDVQARW
ncbi:TPA: hypothetical protein DCZ15_01505 [Candidatus Falkowbacteria bacterium]|nr:MAG: hypothetical protein UV95_C0001G0366 [Candidatus Falkowbacteria bacterium GW2011_GWF2_43_32]HBA36532.1 hypothetical protein [Candidatus Falkowbacteria bacterium]